MRAALLLAPLGLPALVPLERLPAGAAYLVTQGRWLIVLGALAAWATLWLEGRVRLPRVRACGARVWAGGAWGVGVLVLLWSMPAGLWSERRWSGDEPKYLRMADSVHHDLDVDLSAGRTEPLTWRALGRNLRALREAAWDAVGELGGAPPASLDGHAWRAGHWTIAGRHGGHYPVHGAGLPLLLLPARALQSRVDPERPYSLALLTLVGLWALGLWHTLRLAQEVSGAPAWGAAAGAAVACTAPLLLCGRHFYPEVAASAAVPWLARGLRPPAALPGLARTVALAFVCGALPWLHVKFAPLGLAAFVLLLAKLGRERGRVALALVSAGAPVAALLLYTHHVTGLWRPDAFYLRYAPELHAGAGLSALVAFVLGLCAGLFGARDGVLVLAPLLALGIIGVPWLWRRERATVLAFGLLFASVWATAALHGGGAPGPPGRLLAPVLGLLAAPLAAAAVELRGEPRFAWSTAAALVVSAAVSLTLAGSWRRAVDPYEGMFASPSADFSLDLPDAPRPGPPSPGRDLARGALLSVALAAWTVRFARRRAAPPGAWAAARDFHLAAWGTVLVLGTLSGWLRA